ncbi:MAG: hypothetical protein L0H36_01610 [bacterium]|nr:hypothetical protein [bacterium]MDN5835313.1 hypothetical protein [bacterium]
MAKVSASVKKPSTVVESSVQAGVIVAIIGAFVGLVAYFLGLLLEKYILVSLFCESDPAAMCSNLAVTGGSIAAIIAGVGGVVALARLGIYRPLLVGLAALISLWGLYGWTSGLNVGVAIVSSVVLYTLVYLAFSWLARMRQFWISLICIVLLTVVCRLVIL